MMLGWVLSAETRCDIPFAFSYHVFDVPDHLEIADIVEYYENEKYWDEAR